MNINNTLDDDHADDGGGGESRRQKMSRQSDEGRDQVLEWFRNGLGAVAVLVLAAAVVVVFIVQMIR